MDEATARRILLVKSIEERDARGEAIPVADRRWATREAVPPEGVTAAAAGPGVVAFLARRAQLLERGLEAGFPSIAAVRASVHWPPWLAIALAGGSFALGMMSTELDASRHVNILSFPLLGMLGWNVAVYALLLLRWARARMRGPEGTRRPGPWVRAATALQARAARAGERAGTPAPVADGVRAYLAEWAALAAPLYAARGGRLLHVCAALLAAGAAAGLYLRGIAFEYRAGWESTFLDAAAVHAVLQLVLGPAAAATGIALPDAAGVAALRWAGPGTGESAARWIHLYAATAAIFILGPRLALALAAWRIERRLRQRFPLPDGLARYARAVLAERHGDGRTLAARVIACHHTLSPAAMRRLEDRLTDDIGTPVAATLAATVAYGEEEAHANALAQAPQPASDCLILVFGMSAIPEEENHGLLLDAYRSAAGQARLVAVLDETAYRRRLAGQAGADARLAERRGAWQRFVSARGVAFIAVDLGPDEAVEVSS